MYKTSIDGLAGHNKELEEKILKEYAKIRKTGVCKACDKYNGEKVNNGYPASIFVVGEDFQEQAFRVMFVGKTVQDGWESDLIKELGVLDIRKSAQELFYPQWSSPNPFFQSIRQVCTMLWGVQDLDYWRRISITNLVKCSTSTDSDTTPDTMVSNCINAGFFEKEVSMTKPTHIVFFVGPYYNLGSIHFGFDPLEDEVEEKTSIGKKTLLWGHRRFVDSKGSVRMQYLRAYHPGYLNIAKNEVKEQYCRHIAEWVNPKLK